ncbi:MAG: hypothetical protein ACLRMZ_18135 [Blautia marasmi]
MDLLYINAFDIEKLELTNEEILGAVEKAWRPREMARQSLSPGCI